MERILLLLSPYDRLNCSLTCRHWAEIVPSPAVLEDVWMVIRGFAVGSDHFLMQSARRYSNLRLQRGTQNLLNMRIQSINPSCAHSHILLFDRYSRIALLRSRVLDESVCRHPAIGADRLLAGTRSSVQPPASLYNARISFNQR